ncbi:MAG: hypothetical protein P4L92_01515 [Rudaea sp.]|nr:hypothetical protein [Rudaea sp.]
MVAIDNTATAFQIAQIYAFRRETDAAFRRLQHGYDIRDTGLLSINSDPRFALTLGKMGLSTLTKPQQEVPPT